MLNSIGGKQTDVKENLQIGMQESDGAEGRISCAGKADDTL